MTSITNDQIDALLPFLERFQAPDFTAGNWEQQPGIMPWFSQNYDVLEFVQALYDGGWITSFDWPSWQDKAEAYVLSPAMLESADVETIQRLFITHVRKERFCEGHLADMFERGHILALLQRLQTIRSSAD